MKMLKCLGLSDIILQCDPEPSLIKWAESVITSEQRSSGKLSETGAGTGAHFVCSTSGTHAIQTDHRQCTDEIDCSTCSMAHPSFQKTMYSHHSVEPWVVRIVESCWSSANLCLLTFQRWETDLGPEERRRAHASGNRGHGSAAHGEHTPQERDRRGSEALE